MMSSLFQIVLGFTGLVGVLLRFIGPLAIAPTITLVGVALFRTGAEKAGKMAVECFLFFRVTFLSFQIFFNTSRSTLGNFDDVSSSYLFVSKMIVLL